MPTPLVSIVIPTFNRASDLERALRSVCAQSYSAWEALVIDNHSSDSTDQVVTTFRDPRIKLFRIHNDGVIAASRNMGIANAAGEYVAFLDSDDWWLPSKLQESITRLETGMDVVYHDLFYVTKRDQRVFFKHTSSRELVSPPHADLIVNGNVLGTSSVVVRKTLLDEIGGLREDADIVTWEDYDTWIRLAAVTNRISFIDKRLGYCWTGGGNTLKPSRVLANIDAFKRRYVDNDEGQVRQPSVWLPYARGRWLFVTGDDRGAIRNLAIALTLPIPLGLKLRAAVVALMAGARMVVRRTSKSVVSNVHH